MKLIKSAGISGSPHYVAFVDLLGYKEKILTNPPKPPGLFDHFDSYFNTVFKTLDWFESQVIDPAPKSIILGDAIVLWLPVPQEQSKRREAALSLCLAVARLQIEALRNPLGILTRGGISVGQFYSTLGSTIEKDTEAKRPFVFGVGLAKAAELEKKASVPRVLLDKEFVNHLGYIDRDDFFTDFNERSQTNHNGLADWNGPILCQSTGNFRFWKKRLISTEDEIMIDYLDGVVDGGRLQKILLLALKSHLSEGLVNNNQNIRNKYEWLSRYLDAKIASAGCCKSPVPQKISSKETN